MTAALCGVHNPKLPSGSFVLAIDSLFADWRNLKLDRRYISRGFQSESCLSAKSCRYLKLLIQQIHGEWAAWHNMPHPQKYRLTLLQRHCWKPEDGNSADYSTNSRRIWSGIDRALEVIGDIVSCVD